MADNGRTLFGANINVELEQTLLRLLLVVVGTVYGLVVNYLDIFDDGFLSPVVALGYFYVTFSFFSILHVYFRPEGKKWRHTAYMCVDILVTSIVMHYFGKYGVPFFIFYLWLTVGNGFRYGYVELIRCAGVSVCGFIVMCMFTPYWQEEYLLTVACVMLLSIIPLYVAIMLKRLQEAKEKAEQASREKSRFLANISHEIRTPLNAVVGFSSVLDRETDRERQAQLTRGIRDASASLMSLVEGVLDFSRIEAGHVQIKSAPFDLCSLIYSVEAMFSMQAEQSGVRYITEMDADIPQHVNGDSDRLRQILVNLVGNAVKFTSQGEVRLRVSRLQTETHGEQIQFEVIDTGIGISVAMQSRIFERFLQADDSVHRRYGGTGLGTAIAKRLVDLMGGQIGIDSEEHKGSRFWFRISLADAQCAVDSLPDSGMSNTLQQDICQLQGEAGRLKVLVTDDCRLNRHVMKAMLDDMGADSEFASSGPMALEKLRSGTYDLLLLDIQMPGMSGFDVIELYKARNTPDRVIPIVVVTGDATAEIYDKCDELSVSRFLLKPVDHDKLRNALAGLMPVDGGSTGPVPA